MDIDRCNPVTLVLVRRGAKLRHPSNEAFLQKKKGVAESAISIERFLKRDLFSCAHRLVRARGAFRRVVDIHTPQLNRRGTYSNHEIRLYFLEVYSFAVLLMPRD